MRSPGQRTAQCEQTAVDSTPGVQRAHDTPQPKQWKTKPLESQQTLPGTHCARVPSAEPATVTRAMAVIDRRVARRPPHFSPPISGSRRQQGSTPPFRRTGECWVRASDSGRQVPPSTRRGLHPPPAPAPARAEASCRLRKGKPQWAPARRNQLSPPGGPAPMVPPLPDPRKAEHHNQHPRRRHSPHTTSHYRHKLQASRTPPKGQEAHCLKRIRIGWYRCSPTPRPRGDLHHSLPLGSQRPWQVHKTQDSMNLPQE